MNFSNRNNYHPNNDIFWFGNINNSNNLNNNHKFLRHKNKINSAKSAKLNNKN